MILGHMKPARRVRRSRSVLAARWLALLWGSALIAVAGGAMAEAGPVRYRIQPDASDVTFQATSRLMNADGRFHRLSGEVVADPKDFRSTRVSLSIEAASLDTGIGMRDNHLRSEDFFDVKQFPTITFESARVEGSGGRVMVVGRLTVRGVTREVAVPVSVNVTDTALMASGELVVNRRDFGLSYQSVLNPIGNDVRVAFTFRARAV
jgi:polyisoprenoid-binding protein YceI